MNESINEILVHILTEKASAEDLLNFSNWLNEDPRNKEEFRKLKCYWDAEVSYQTMVDPAIELKKILTALSLSPQKSIQTYLRKPLFWGIAASLAIIIGISSFMLYNVVNPRENYTTYLTDERKSTFTMEDGTEVTLNKNSRLIFSNRFGKKDRNVTLEGEAYFNVTKDALHPYTITVNDSQIKVLGTEFNVKEDKINEEIVATLIKGSIHFQNKDQEALIKPGQQLTYAQENESINIKEVDTRVFTDWHTDLLKYASVPLTKLFKDLEDHYSVEIQINNPRFKKSEVTISCTFDKNQNIEQILKVISKSVPIKWQNNNGTYYIN